MKTSHKAALVAATTLAGIAIVVAFTGLGRDALAEPAPAPAAGQPVLAVDVTTLGRRDIPIRVSATGNIMPWQEASVGTEADGLRLVEVNVNVGDRVRRGQLLARFAHQSIDADLAQARAALAEARVALDEAAANARRARVLQESGAMAAQQIEQYLSAERAAAARLDAARGRLTAQELRLVQTRIVAPDEGIISLRAATVGAVTPAGQELFRLIRGGRLEWRAEVAAGDLARLAPGQQVRITLPGGESASGRLRMLAPAIDLQTRNGMAYVDLAPQHGARAGMFARGQFELGVQQAATLPHSATQQRDGFHYVMRVGPDSRTIQTRVTTGRRIGDRIEIVDGLGAQERVVVAGGAFLGDGDLVRIAPQIAPQAGAARQQGAR